MKKSFFFAAVAAMFVVSCKQVEIDSEAGKTDEGQIEAGEGQTVIGAVIVDSKTVLGTPEENVYPVNWQEGDAICVNSVTSRALTAADFDGMSARFTFDAALEPPYKAVYPASAVVAASATGVSVKVPMVQRYTAGSFDPDAAIMLGTGSPDVTFINAMSFIKVKTTGSDKIAQVMVTSLGTEPMSGDFKSTDFAALEPDTDKNTFSSVVVVAETPVDAGTDIIAAIPTQAYASGFMITIQTPDGKIFQKKSTKAFNPQSGHMYAVTLAYAPVAVEGTVTIDGNFSDWQTVPCVTYTLHTNNSPAYNIARMSLTADDDFVYGYIVMDETYPNHATWFDIFVDADGNSNTGGKLASLETYDAIAGPYASSGVEWYIEGGIFNGSTYTDAFAKYRYGGLDGDNVFTKLNNITSEITTDQFAMLGASNGKGIGGFEFKMEREKFEMLGTKAAFGCKNLINSQTAGLLPQSSDIANVRLPMAALTMKRSSHKPLITIDGDFSDWEAVKDEVQTYALPANALLPNAHSMSFIADDKYVYVKLDAKDNKGVDGGVMLDFYIDSDGDPLTGMCMNELGSIGVSGNMFLSGGVDWYMQSSLYNGANYFNLVTPGYFLNCVGGFGLPYGGGAVCENHGSECDASRSFAAIAGTDDGNLHMEWRLSREYFGMTGPKARFGLRYGCPGWTTSGALPQGSAEGGNYTKANLFKVLLPSDKPIEPIEIDGDFTDWDNAEGVQTFVVPDGALYTAISQMDVVATPRYIYVRYKAKHDATLNNQFYFVLDIDGNNNTGFSYSQGSTIFWGNEWEIQILNASKGSGYLPTPGNQYYDSNPTPHALNRNAVSVSKKANTTNCSEFKGYMVYSGTDDSDLELRIDRKYYGYTGTKGGIGLRFYHGGSKCVGVCPQGVAKDSKVGTDTFIFDLPAFAE